MIDTIAYTGLHGDQIMKLAELYSRAEASAALDIPIITLKRWHSSGRFQGIPVGQRPSGGAHVIVYSRRMLEDARNGRFPIAPTEEELNSVMAKADVAAYTGLTMNQVHYHTHTAKNLPVKIVGGTTVYIRRDVDRFLRETAQARVQVVGGMVDGYDLATAVAQYRQAHGLSQQVLADMVGVARQTLGQFELGRDVTLKADVYGRLLDLLCEANDDEAI